MYSWLDLGFPLHIWLQNYTRIRLGKLQENNRNRVHFWNYFVRSPPDLVLKSDFCSQIQRSSFEILEYQWVYWYPEITFKVTRRNGLRYIFIYFNWNRTCSIESYVSVTQKFLPYGIEANYWTFIPISQESTFSPNVPHVSLEGSLLAEPVWGTFEYLIL